MKLSSLVCSALILSSFVLGTEAHAATLLRGQNVFAASNTIRVARKLKPLAPNGALVRAAQMKADDMERRDYFAHASPEGWRAYHWVYLAKGNQVVVGENLAKGFSSVETLENGWMNSPTHRAILLGSDWTQTGVGISKDGKYVVQYFGR